MNGLMMDYQLTLTAMMRRAEQLFGHKEVVTRLADKSLHRYSYADWVRRTKQLSLALQGLGIQPGDRVATFCWNHHQHLEAYFGVPACGAVLHTLNLRLHPDDLTYIVNEAEDKAILIDVALLPLFEKFRDRVKIDNVIVIADHGEVPEGYLAYEDVLAGADPRAFSYPDFDEQQAAVMCYTSGTTGQPKGVLYSHRAIVLHSLGLALPDTIGIGESDVVLPVVPMFHANAWGMPFAATFVGAKQVFPGPHLDPASLLEVFQNEKVTLTGGVPTIWMGILQTLNADPDAYDLSSLHTLAVGGAAAPKSMIQEFQERHGLNVLHAWGMTETTPLGTVARIGPDLSEAPEDQRYDHRAKQGRPVPLVEMRARSADGLVPWDGKTLGELEVRGPWVAGAYFKEMGGGDRFTEDGWFRTGDVVTIDPHGWMEIQDRAKDLVKSGGEWISSVALENALMGHHAVAEAAVIALPHPKWQERPLAAVVLADGSNTTADELRAFLGERFAKWWIPDAVEFVEKIPRTAVGKFKKTALREQFRDYKFQNVTDSTR
jgi:fatty-acyl-CoA synthase